MTTTSAPEKDLTASLGRTWFTALDAGGEASPRPAGLPGSILTGTTTLDGETAALVAIAPDPNSVYPRARAGEVGLAEGLGLASWVRSLPAGVPIVLVIDVPSQAYGYVEELFGLHQALAASVQALAERRLAGDPVVSVIVGAAISGAFLATGLQSGRIVALDHDGIQVQVMSKQSTARITRRSIAELDKAAEAVPAVAYDGASFQKLGAVDTLVHSESPSDPTDADVDSVLGAVAENVAAIRASDETGLAGRLHSEGARANRGPSIVVRKAVDEQW